MVRARVRVARSVNGTGYSQRRGFARGRVRDGGWRTGGVGSVLDSAGVVSVLRAAARAAS
jgi:hypothetical protein